jgi:hypothetical protein
MLKKILIVILVLVAGFLAYATTRPDSYKVERSTKIDAPGAVVFGELEDLKAWAAWSPWEAKDPQMKKTYEGPPSGVGAGYAWQGNDKVGEGKMTIVASQPPTQIQYRLEFVKPFAAVSTTSFNLTPDGDKATTVIWSMEGTNNLVGKIFGVFMNMDKMVGDDFDKGLAGLKQVAEVKAKQEAAAKAQAAAVAAKAQADAAAVLAAKAQAEAAAAELAASESKTKGKKKH